MRTLILGNMSDLQTGIYILESFREITSDCAGIDTRKIILELGLQKGQEIIVSEAKNISFTPELIIVMKGIEMTKNTLEAIRTMYPAAILVNWFFDKFIDTAPIWKNEKYKENIPIYDYFFCSLKGVADKLNSLGFDNVKYLDEGCYPTLNGTTYYNYYQQKK